MFTLLCQQREKQLEQGARRQWNDESEGKALPISDDREAAARRRLADDRKREYQEMREEVLYTVHSFPLVNFKT